MSIPHPPTGLDIEGLKQFIKEHNLTPVNFVGKTRTLPLIRADIIFNVDTVNRKTRRMQNRSSPVSPARDRLPNIRGDLPIRPAREPSPSRAALTSSASAQRRSSSDIGSPLRLASARSDVARQSPPAPLATAASVWMETSAASQPQPKSGGGGNTAQMAVEAGLRQELAENKEYIQCIRDPQLMERIQSVLTSDKLQQQLQVKGNLLTSQRLSFRMKETAYQGQIAELQEQIEVMRKAGSGVNTPEANPVVRKDIDDKKCDSSHDWYAMALIAGVVAILAFLVTIQIQLNTDEAIIQT